MKKLKKQKAFTLVELIIVITILAILSTISFLSFKNYFKSARDSVKVETVNLISKGLTIFYIESGEYPEPDDYTDVVGVSHQGYVRDKIKRIIKLSGGDQELKDGIYMYSVDKDKKKAQIAVYLEENNATFFSYKNFVNNAYATNIDYTNKYLYTYGDKIGILLDKETKRPVQEIYNTGSLDLTTNTGTYIVQFTNSTTNSGIITGSGQDLLTNITIIQNTCLLGNTVVQNGGQINAYNANTVAYNEICTPITRKCNNGILDGDVNYKYDICSQALPLNCASTTYSGYTIPAINHNTNQNVTKIITGGIADIQVNCVNGNLSYGTENINCDVNYVLDAGECKQDICTGAAPDWSISNGTQKYNTNWNYNPTPNYCTFICQAGYYWNNTICAPSSAGYYVSTAGATTQTACGGNTLYQGLTGQTSCNTVSTGYYTTGGTATTRTGQTQCEVNNWCSGGVKTACATGYSSPAGSTSISNCTINTYTVSGTVTNGNGATVNICGKTTTADTSGNFSVTADYGTVCNNAVITKTNYTCTTTTNGPTSLTSNYTTVAGNCVANTQTITTCLGIIPTGGISNAITTTRTQTWNGTIWTPTNSRTYNAIAGTCTYRCNAGYYWNGTSCTAASGGYYVASAGATAQTACTTGQYQDTTGQTTFKSCTNKPANSTYTTSIALTTNTCPWSCDSGFYQSGGNCLANPTNLSLSHTTRTKTFTFSLTAGVGNGGSCKLQYYKNGTTRTDISTTTYNCDSNISNQSVTLSGDGWNSTWSSIQVRIIRTSDSVALGTFPQTLTCSAISGSSTSTPSIDEDCNGIWDNNTSVCTSTITICIQYPTACGPSCCQARGQTCGSYATYYY